MMTSGRTSLPTAPTRARERPRDRAAMVSHDVTVTTASLARRLGLGDAVFIGLGSMIGAGVFAAFGPAARPPAPACWSGSRWPPVVAYCNATSSAQLAAAYPTSGGTYLYGREVLGDWWGYLAGWGFMVGKTASCAAMALTFGAYAVAGPRWLQRLIALPRWSPSPG